MPETTVITTAHLIIIWTCMGISIFLLLALAMKKPKVLAIIFVIVLLASIGVVILE